MSGTLPRVAGDPTPPDPRIRGTWSLGLGIASLALGFIWVVPVVAIVLGVSSRRREPEARRRALGGIVLGAVSLAAWVLFAGPLLDLIGFF
ncbi:hypothetical protein [Homoserinibacter sp. YIM 151385]|uniref:hypothetical protein n=1 Tax=Homoserinibacter sp. YIM 151385 TaxID=2985506 RepID=UPI0022F1120D|nr:hypothetical protein [Homoserinibacter sp. YIM 151385]WBU37387.1 hypothetical protein OF852_10745 [Homoserinibacter sp. YIM 151385]